MKKQTIRQLFARPLLHVALTTLAGCTNGTGGGNRSATSLQSIQTPETKKKIQAQIKALRELGFPPRTAKRLANFQVNQERTIEIASESMSKNKTLADLTATERAVLDQAKQAVHEAQQYLKEQWNQLALLEQISQATGSEYDITQTTQAEAKCDAAERAFGLAAQQFMATIQKLDR